MSFKIDNHGDLVWKNEKGKYYREKGPALICTGGGMQYRLNDYLHRLDGPAAIYPNGDKYYWIHNKKYYTKESYLTKVRAKVQEL